MANSTSGFGTLENTGLVQGFTASVLPEGTDIADYNGPRTGLDTNGYQLALNDWTNFHMQDTDEDDHNDGITPDLPFDLTLFNLSSTDVTAPQVVDIMVQNQTTVTVVFSEEVSETSATNTANYSFAPTLTITEVSYNAETSTATITHDGFSVGMAYNLTVENVEDTAATNMESSYTSEDLFYNGLTEGLIITEIMYNAPSDVSDELEFLEIYNNSDATLSLGGIQVKDEDNFVFTFPEMDLASEEIVLLATDKTAADAFYGVTFLDMPQGIVNALSNGGELLEILNSEGITIFSVEYDDGDSWPLADGDGPSIELLNPEGDFNAPLNYTEATNLVGQSMGEDVFASPGSFTPVFETLPVITFEESYSSVNENGTEITIEVSLSEAPLTGIFVQVNPINTESTAIEGQHFNFSQQTLTFTPMGDLTQEVTVNIVDNNDAEPDTFLVLGLGIDNSELAELGENIIHVVYILDDEMHAPTASENLGINFGTSYAIEGDNPGSEIVAHDAETERLFVLNSGNASLEILDFSEPLNISAITTVDLSSYGEESTSVAHFNGLVAATAVPEVVGENGTIIFMDTDGTILSTVEVGSLPDMITFSHDGNMLLVANEGQPNDDYTIDPEGSISVIDLTNGAENLTQTDVTTLDFHAFDTQEEQLKTAGVRIFGPNASVSQDLEPEYITVSEDNTKAWVTLQENNAIAVVDLTNLQITDIWPLGYKNHSLAENALDTSNEQDFIFMANWPIKGMYMPDAIANYTVNGNTYFVTANEGDAREYDACEEEVDLEDLVLDTSVFTNQAFLEIEENLGKLTFTNVNGDIDNDDEYEELYVFGGRSFSIYDANTGTQVYDSGSDFERIIKEDPVYNAIFNANDDENELKNRSDNKGPEPEAVIVQEIDGTFYAFIGLERVGGFMVYDITNPNTPVFEGYYNNRSVTPGEDYIENLGDLAPESIVYVAPENNAEEKGLIVLANEVSATISVYTLDNDVLSTNDFELAKNNFVIYPNPATSERVFFNEPTDYMLFDIQGRKLQEASQATHINVSTLTTGTYLVRNAKGQVQKLVIN